MSGAGITHAFVSLKPDGADPTKVSENKWNAPHVLGAGWLLQGAPDFGLGIDGALTFDGATTVLGMAPSGGVYTLARDIHATAITFTGTAKLALANWRLFCQGAITGVGHATTHISNDGNPGAANVAGASTAAGAYAATMAGGAGVSGTATGTDASTNASAPPIYAGATVAGGSGSSGGSSDGAAGAAYGQGGGGGGSSTGTSGEFAGGTSISSIAASHGYTPVSLETGRDIVGAAAYVLGCGGGGGSAIVSSGSAAAIGGGGGAAAGRAYVAAQSIIGVTISARGGNGANGSRPTGGGAGNGAGGGGGGGAGGEVVVKFSTCSDLACDVTGGTGGTGDAVGASHIGRNGGAGYKGYVFAYNLTGDGTAPTVVP